MQIEFDADKEAANVAKHDVSLSRAVELNILSVLKDDRFDYGEVRFRAWGLIDGEPHCLVFTTRGAALRAISLRRAHKKEMRRYVPQDTSR